MVAARPTVIIDTAPRRVGDLFAPEDWARLREHVDVAWGRDEPLPPTALAAALPTAIAIICAEWRYGECLDAAPALRAIVSVTASFPRSPALDETRCFARGIRLLSTAPAFGRPVAELALGLALASGRGIAAGDRAMRDGNERWRCEGSVGATMLYEQPVGFVGYGGLARALRPLLAPFGCPVAVHDPWLGDGYLRSEGVTPIGLPQLLAESRIIFVLAAPSSENRALLSRQLLALIRPGAILVLFSRAHVVDFDALTEFVLAGRFRAAIDVFPVEPLPPDHPIRRAEGAILSAHRAGSPDGALRAIGRLIADDLEAITRGLPPQCMSVTQPELVARYADITTPRPVSA